MKHEITKVLSPRSFDISRHPPAFDLVEIGEKGSVPDKRLLWGALENGSNMAASSLSNTHFNNYGPPVTLLLHNFT